MKKISFIIPSYNSQDYINSTIAELCNDIKNYSEYIEIIIIENGSNDNSVEIIKNIIKKNKYDIKLFKSDKGVSNARNFGISKSSGDYLIFIDSDDIWLPGSIETILNDVLSNKDLYMYSFIKGKRETTNENCKKIIHQITSEKKEDIINWIISKPTLRAQTWAKVYKKSIIVENNIMFNKELKYSEDSEFVLRFLKYVNTINVSSVPIYKYVLTEGSTMRKKSDERIEQYIKSMKCTIQEYENNSEYYNSVNKYIACHLNIILVHDVFIYGNKLNVCIKKYKQIKKEKIFVDSTKNIKLKECLCKELLVEFFIKLHLDVLVALICFFKSYLNNR